MSDDTRAALARLCVDAVPRPDCPEPLSLWDAATGEGTPSPETLRVLDHVARCPACQEAWRLAVALEESGNRSGRYSWALLATALVLSVAVTALPLLLPAREAELVLDAVEITSPWDDGVVVDPGALVLTWSGPPGALWDVAVGDEHNRPIASASLLAEPRFSVPPERLEGLPPGTMLYWRADAQWGDQRILSPTFTVTLGARPK